jgi:carnitine O-acetyltransferase
MCYNDMSDTHNVLRQLQQVVQQVDSIPQNELQPPIGLLTSEHRETWAKASERAF